jgi:hypothetical protein
VFYENLYSTLIQDTTLRDASEVCTPRCWNYSWKRIKNTKVELSFNDMTITSKSYKNPLSGQVEAAGVGSRKTHTHIRMCNHTYKWITHTDMDTTQIKGEKARNN